MALVNTIWKHVNALFGAVNTSTVVIDTDIKRAYERTLSINVDPSTNGQVDTTKRHIFYAKTDMTVIGVSYVPDGTLALNATNYQTLTVYAGTGAAAAATSVATANTSATAMAAGTPFALTLSATAANLDVDAGETLAYDTANAGTSEAAAIPKGALVIHYRER